MEHDLLRVHYQRKRLTEILISVRSRIGFGAWICVLKLFPAENWSKIRDDLSAGGPRRSTASQLGANRNEILIPADETCSIQNARVSEENSSSRHSSAMIAGTGSGVRQFRS